jgi:hypothetical protein
MEYSSTGTTVHSLPSHDKKPNGEEGLADAANVIRRIRNTVCLSHGSIQSNLSVELPNIHSGRG